MRHLGDYAEDATVDCKFNTHQANGTPITLAGSPAVSVYKANSTTESTEGVTFTVDFDSVTGLHHVRVDTSAHAFYATGSDYQIVLTAGTVDGTSVAGTTLAEFSIENRQPVAALSAIASAVADKTGYKLASDGLDSITASEPTGKPTTFSGWVMWLVQRFRRATKSTTEITVQTEAGADVTTQTITDDGAGNETLGPPS